MGRRSGNGRMAVQNEKMQIDESSSSSSEPSDRFGQSEPEEERRKLVLGYPTRLKGQNTMGVPQPNIALYRNPRNCA